MGESKAHIKLKERAKKFLKSLGLDEIIEEYPTGVNYSDFYFIINKEAYVDVTGFKGIKSTVQRYVARAPGYYADYPASWDRIALVECGDTPRGKLRTLARRFEEVYHFPYGRKIERVKREQPRNVWERRQERINDDLARRMGVIV